MKRLFPLFRAAAPALVLAGLISGCGNNSSQSSASKAPSNVPLPTPPLVATCAPGIPGGRLVISSFAEPKTFNPITANESSSQDIIRLLYAGLVGLDTPTQEILPGMAE